MFERIKSPQHMYTAVHLYTTLLLYYTPVHRYAVLILENVCAFYGGNTKPF